MHHPVPPRSLRKPQIARFALLLTAAATLSGCGAPKGPDAFRGLDEADRYASRPQGRRIGTLESPPPATVDGEPVTWEEVQAYLGEAAGAAVLDEIALERRLAREMTRRGLSLSEEAIEQERLRLTQTLAGGTQGNEERLIAQVRARRGLGPTRYAAMLRRNAMLRSLVADRVDVRPDQIDLAWRVQHGEKLAIRIIVTPTERQAALVRQQLADGDPTQLEARFISLAPEQSTDPSGSRGGQIEPFSAADPAYEPAVRAAADQLQPGQLGPIVAVRSGFALVYLQRRVPADGVTLEGATPVLARELRIRQERLLMDELAAQLLAEAKITTFDDALGWSRQAGSAR